MAARKSRRILFGIFVISAWVLGSAFPAGAETLNYKFYSYLIKIEKVPIADVEGHAVELNVRGAFYVFENGEVATAYGVSTGDTIKDVGSFMQYLTLTFPDGSTIIRKDQAIRTGEGVRRTSEIIKGTGRFEGIKGAHTAKGKPLPVETWEAGPKVIGEGTYTYTLPTK